MTNDPKDPTKVEDDVIEILDDTLDGVSGGAAFERGRKGSTGGKNFAISDIGNDTLMLSVGNDTLFDSFSADKTSKR